MLTTGTKLNNFHSVIFQSCKFSYPARGGKRMQNHVKTHSITSPSVAIPVPAQLTSLVMNVIILSQVIIFLLNLELTNVVVG